MLKKITVLIAEYTTHVQDHVPHSQYTYLNTCELLCPSPQPWLMEQMQQSTTLVNQICRPPPRSLLLGLPYFLGSKMHIPPSKIFFFFPPQCKISYIEVW